MNRREALCQVTASRLHDDFRKLGVRPGGLVMLHASVRSVGWIVGGPGVVLRSLCEVLGRAGTLCMYVGWADGTYEMSSWSAETQRAYLEECPPFDPLTSRACPDWGVLTELLRTMPGARRSSHPEASMAAVGRRAEWLTHEHPLQYGYGPGSPFERVVQAQGQVLLLGSPHGAVTLLHFSEHLANVPNKRIVRYRAPLAVEGERRWVDIEELDTARGIVSSHRDDYFADLVDDYLARGYGATGFVGGARSYLLDAADLNAFAVRWMEDNLTTGDGCVGATSLRSPTWNQPRARWNGSRRGPAKARVMQAITSTRRGGQGT